MSYTLLITEKPSSAQKIAIALADGDPKKLLDNGVPYYQIKHCGKEIVVVPAVGHLYGLREVKEKGSLGYPTFNTEWAPIADFKKEAAFSKKYLALIKKLAKKASDFCLGTDYDIEGETLGYNILRFACGKDDAKRMKYSTLTQKELIESYDHAMPHIDHGQADAGVTRHTLDWYYGINLSRALTSSIKAAGTFKILSSGRVQGPALKIIVDREREIKSFKPVPFWQLCALASIKDADLEFWHVIDKFWEESKAAAIYKKVGKEKSGIVKSIDASQQKQAPPHPFDLTTLQTEAYTTCGISPKNTLAIAQSLYLRGLISYPRTASQQLPESLGFKTLLAKLAKQSDYKPLVEIVLKGKRKPNNGKKTDPAHPAIYPTGVIPKSLEERDAKIYDLVVRRFLATFGEPAVRETQVISLEIKGEDFNARGTRTIEKGWHALYGPFVKLEEEELPHVKKGELVPLKKIDLLSKETQPPKRYNEASIIKELEKRNLGTKATRAQIVETLRERNYAAGAPIEATEFGMHIADTLEKYCPKILDEELTRSFEEEMDLIREEKAAPDKVLAKAKDVLTKILADFKKKEKQIGAGLMERFSETRTSLSTLGSCPSCKQGLIQIRKGKFGRFAACNRYPDCKTTFKLPAAGAIKATGKECEQCKYPMILMFRAKKKPQQVCVNAQCPSKDQHFENEGKECPKCKEGKLVVRKSVYGGFLACGRFPKCFYIETRSRAPLLSP
ncbi:DNA topoisomerase I [Candidatus Woesearchaeota archaeon]|nr:DNA topoisomerase I [Candidatus Woesearchaeota archaeon]